MITNKGKSILSKYLVDGASAYASHIAVGCGGRPRKTFSVNISSTESSTGNAGSGNAKIITSTEHDFEVGDYVKIYNNNGSNINSKYIGTWQITNIPDTTSFKFAIGDTTVRSLASLSPSPKVIIDFSNKTTMDFEMLRQPIVSKTSYVENGLSVIELSANLPTIERYEISEIGLFSDDVDSASTINNQVISNFSGDQTWSYHKGLNILTIPFKTSPLDIGSAINSITVTDEVFQANSDNSVFNNTIRIYKQEKPRYQKSTYFMLGNTSTLDNSSGILTPNTVTNHMEASISGLSYLANASTEDEIRFALSLVNKVNATAAPDEVRVLLEFATQEGSGNETTTYRYARFHGIKTSSEQNFSTNRYVVFSKKMSELQKSQNFSWADVAFVKVYVSIIKSSSPSADYYAALDSIKFEYTSSINPLYALTGYTLIKNSNNLTITKEENAEQTITFKFVVGV